MSNAEEKRVSQLAQRKGYRLEKVGKGPHHGRFSIVHITEGSRANSGVRGSEFAFTLQEADEWLASKEK